MMERRTIFFLDFREENMAPKFFMLCCLFLETKQGLNERRTKKRSGMTTAK
jgi:hypothetical protein